jgi:hypothetical protein
MQGNISAAVMFRPSEKPNTVLVRGLRESLLGFAVTTNCFATIANIIHRFGETFRRKRESLGSRFFVQRPEHRSPASIPTNTVKRSERHAKPLQARVARSDAVEDGPNAD